MSGSSELFERARRVIPGGVNSPVRAFGSVEGNPVFMEKGVGSAVYDVDGVKYVDFCCSWGPLILGHADPDVVEAVKRTAENGLSFGICNPLEVEMAELLEQRVPHADMFRMVNSGTEAVMTALRLARGYTERSMILKFDGCYHGHSDALLVNAGSGLLTQSVSSSAGVSANVASEVVSVPYNDIESVDEAFAKYKDRVAAVIVEPVAGNMGLVRPKKGFLEALRELSAENGALLVFDEVITGFRFHAGTFAELIGVLPDITVLGKIIGGGMPIGAIGASKEIMSHLAPTGGVYQAGTLSGNPVALAAGIATLRKLVETNPYPKLERMAARLAENINRLAAEKRLPSRCEAFGGAFTIFFTSNRPLENLADVAKCDTDAFASFHRRMLDAGFYLSPSQFELDFISTAHTEEDVNAFGEAVADFAADL
ncbi:MAG: glutamate-1-semialdehyde 2,1-aminomutase [Kiritimatiellaeota bacterium]|nr:glutamate-1-semialdehyde 2,1-aminomutase [Kiritimatiellota bacterium]